MRALSLSCAVAAGLVATAHASYCFEKFNCVSEVTQNDKIYRWELDGLCQQQMDYVLDNPMGRTGLRLFLQICGNSYQSCFPPDNVQRVNGGVAVIMNVSSSSYAGSGCGFDKKHDCTPWCRVLGSGVAKGYTLIDASNPDVGITNTFNAIPPLSAST